MGSVDKWVQETFAPVVLTCTTPEVERLAQKNNLAFADVLNGFAMIKSADTPLRSVAHSFTLADFNVRFLSASQFAPLALPDSIHMLNEVVMRNPPSALSPLVSSSSPSTSAGVIDLDIPTITGVEDVPVFLRVIGAANNTEPLPWYREFKRTLMDTFRCEEYSMMAQPAAMLLVVSSTESNPRASFEALGAPQNLPGVFAQGMYDSNLAKFYLVVHDVVETEGTSIDPDSILRNLQIPPNAGAVLYFNSRAIDAATPANVQIWNKHAFVRAPLFQDVNSGSYPFLSEHYGAFLSSEDLGRLDAFVRDLALRFVLPALESRIFQLNEVVSAKKKGVKNVFKSWLRKPIDLSARTQLNNNNSSSVTYRADSIQAQVRLLADTAFMVRDYELALEMYRLVRDDYKSDTSLLHAANTNEMIALCLLLTKGSPVQMTNALEAATSVYDKSPNPMTARLAVRAAVIAGEIYVALSHSGLFTDYMDNASAALIRGSTKEQGICSAVLMERAAMCDLQARTPKFRKFGFRMVIAGHVYDSSGHSAHSARCYSLTRAVYDCSGWFHVEDHINFTLAQQSTRLNDPMASIHLFLKLIGTGRSSASQQENLLSQFRSIVKEFLASGGAADGNPTSRNGPVLVKQPLGSSTKKLIIRDLCMPELDDKSTVVFAPVNATGINRDIDGNEAERDVWKELEKLLERQIVIHKQATTPGMSNTSKDGQLTTTNRWLAPVQAFNLPYRNKRGAANIKPKQYAIGEKIYVEFEMKNALSCAVEVENIHLYGNFEAKDGPSFDVPESDDFANDQRIVVDSVNLQLLPVSEERVRLAVCPMVPGTLRITGVRWSICGGDVLGEHTFHIPGPLLQDTRANKEARARAPNVTLVADVVGHMPWLGVTIEPAFPSSDVFVGEIVRYNVSLHNAGSADLGYLQVCCSDLMLCVSTGGEPNGFGDGTSALAEYIGASGQVVDLAHVVLRPGERREVTMWAKANQVGKLQPHVLFKYRRLVEGEDPERALSRSVRAKLDLTVMPCVEVVYSIEPSYCSSGEYILALTVTNRKPRRQQQPEASASISLEKLVCVSDSWNVIPFIAASTKDSLVRTAARLDAQETSTSYFRVLSKDSDQLEGKTTVSLSPNSHDASSKLPLDQMLCLDHALELVRASTAASSDSAGDRGAGGGGGMRSIQSVRRSNQAQKGGAADQSPQEDKPDPQPTTKAALLHSLDVDAHLILVWSSPKPSSSSAAVAVGQTNLTSVKVRSPLKPNACPLTVTLQYADTAVLHSAPHAPALSFAEVDVVMTVRNDSSLSSNPIDFTLELLPPEQSKTSLSGKLLGPTTSLPNAALAPAPHFFWSGLTKKHVSQFAPNTCVQFTLKACFMSAGVYDLNRFRFRISPSQATEKESPSLAIEPGVFMFPVEYLVYVQPSTDCHQHP
jgi:trafficking protein particle complex subunit 8